jgi:hypothetical protein
MGSFFSSREARFSEFRRIVGNVSSARSYFDAPCVFGMQRVIDVLCWAVFPCRPARDPLSADAFCYVEPS